MHRGNQLTECAHSSLLLLKDGKLIATGTTEELVKLVEGKVWNTTIPASALPEYEHKLRIVNLRNENDGSVSIRYLAEQSLVKFCVGCSASGGFVFVSVPSRNFEPGGEIICVCIM